MVRWIKIDEFARERLTPEDVVGRRADYQPTRIDRAVRSTVAVEGGLYGRN
jgi:hypothetical protein